MDPDRLIGLAYVANQWHSGQGSRGYRLMSRIQWVPRTDAQAALLPREENRAARIWAAHYTRRARNEPNLF